VAHRGDQQGPPSESANGDDPAGRPRPHPAAAGQHYVVRLTADDGYTASRSYSVCSAPSDPLLECSSRSPTRRGFQVLRRRGRTRRLGGSPRTDRQVVRLERPPPGTGDRRWDRSGANRRDAAPCQGDRGHRPVHPGGGGQNDGRSALRRRVHRGWCDVVLSRQDYRARAAGRLSAADLKPSMARDTPATCAAPLDSPSRPGNCWWRWASMSAAPGSKDSGSAGGDGRGSTACLFGRRRTDERAPWRHDVPRPA
jgi:hypothetical protein